MATRRPKVPRAAAAAPKSVDLRRAEPDDGGDVIRADFGGIRHGAGPVGRTAVQHPGTPAETTPGTGRRGPAGATPSGTTTASGATTAPGTKTASGTKTAGAAAPAAGRGGAGTGTGQPGPADGQDPVPAKAFSGRLLALGVVMIAITIMLAPTVRIFLEKRTEIAELEADISAKQAKQADLKREVSRWQDPNYVKQQARDRINMVMPGETGYWVYGSDLPAASSAAGSAASSAQNPANLPWVDSLWESIRRSATD